ncbi:MAG TPA: MurT ligase domain-containing protein, partial [Acetobacteraceae bacterium]|nr:MurT ligase domain-containing protein [Acetobacteraceae bacterium]
MKQTLARLLARPLARAARQGLKLAGHGGTSLPGRIALAFDPAFIARARRFPRRVVVTGTNGKTSTVSLITLLLRSAGLSVVSNMEGANMRQGLAAALLAPPAEALVMEVDEFTLPETARALDPQLVVVTGLFRDQLDRYGEVAVVRDTLQRAIDTVPEATILLNGDDPLTASLRAARRRFFRLTQAALDVPGDCAGCPQCGAPLSYRSRTYAQLGEFECPACGFAAPEADARGVVLPEAFVFNGTALPPLPVHLHPYSVLASLAAVDALGLPARIAAWPAPILGRGGSVTMARRKVTVVLGKNPASVSWNLAQHPGDAHLFLVNNRAADGRDVSWLWDVNLAPVSRAVATGERALEMLTRLRYEPQIAQASAYPKPEEAFAAALRETPEGGHLVVVATYTQLPAALALTDTARRPTAVPAAVAPEAVAQPRAPLARRPHHVRIALLFPEQLGTYGDSGNAVVLQKRLQWRGIEASIDRIGLSDVLSADADILLLGGGEDRGQRLALASMRAMQPMLKAMAEDGVPALLVCGGLQPYGESLTLEGVEHEGLGILPIVTRPGKPRLVGKLCVNSPLVPHTLVGFENHGGHTTLLGGTRLGEVVSGNGNAATGSQGEGILLHRTIGTYLHGPVLARNPALADVMLGWVAERHGWGALDPLEDAMEARAARALCAG